jgi:hypothetical protein
VIPTGRPGWPVTCPLYLFWYTIYLKNYKLTILGNKVKQVGRESFLATDPPPSILLLSHNHPCRPVGTTAKSKAMHLLEDMNGKRNGIMAEHGDSRWALDKIG